jgi:hypothetical protein
MRLLFIVMLLAGLPSAAFADDAQDQRWGVTLWGLSYHVNKSIDYAAGNYGLGLRFYPVKRYLFIEVDALRNSNRGLVVPLSLGAEFPIIRVSVCRVGGIAAFTAAYYDNPRRDLTEIKVGPVPGISFGCGHFKTNVVAVLSKSDHPLAAVAASLTILF